MTNVNVRRHQRGVMSVAVVVQDVSAYINAPAANTNVHRQECKLMPV